MPVLTPALLLLPLLLWMAAPAQADEALAKSKHCMACHDKGRVGPEFKKIAERYKGDASASDRLAKKIINGGGTVWGAVPMPANRHVNEADAKKLADWVLIQK
ncbi:c-type cytochrome [Variovorax sp. HJSM1_2]|uniref:c-type cytochrome n=1 Tax=Variovorax sp. HJSM1_2 TaxID=3366263 RepID=UPI003BEC38DA